MKKRLEYISLRIVSLMMSMLLLLSIASPALAADFTESKVQIGADVDNGQTGAASAFTTSLDATGVTVDKYVEKTGDDQFMLTLDKENVDRIHIAMKSVESTTAKVKIYEAGINQADAELREINTATDLYYDITDLNGKTVIIYNAGSTESDSTDSVLSVTNIKTTHTSSPETQDQAKGYTMSLATLKTAFYSLRNKAVEPVTTAPFTDAEPTEPAVTTPEGTEPTEVPSTSEETEPSQLIPTQEQESTVPEEVLMGDVNLDGKVNIKDASSIQKYVALIINLPHKGEAVADYDVSGDINIKDATAIQKVLAGLSF